MFFKIIFNKFNSSSLGGPNLHRKLTRSASVTPPISVPTSVSDWLNSQDDLVLRNSQHYNHNVVMEGHAPLSPQSSVTSSGSGSDSHETDHHQRNTFLEECSGMKGSVLGIQVHSHRAFVIVSFDVCRPLIWIASQKAQNSSHRQMHRMMMIRPSNNQCFH